jgi:hypothetical protein
VVRVCDDVLDELRAGAEPGEAPSRVRIWPEQFDAAIAAGDDGTGRRATYGASPGDRHHPEPYHASPWAGRIDAFFDAPASRAPPATAFTGRPA